MTNPSGRACLRLIFLVTSTLYSGLFLFIPVLPQAVTPGLNRLNIPLRWHRVYGLGTESGTDLQHESG